MPAKCTGEAPALTCLLRLMITKICMAQHRKAPKAQAALPSVSLLCLQRNHRLIWCTRPPRRGLQVWQHVRLAIDAHTWCCCKTIPITVMVPNGTLSAELRGCMLATKHLRRRTSRLTASSEGWRGSHSRHLLYSRGTKARVDIGLLPNRTSVHYAQLVGGLPLHRTACSMRSTQVDPRSCRRQLWSQHPGI